MRSVLFAFLLAGVSAFAQTPAASTATPQTASGQAAKPAIVSVFVSVVDGEGRPVPNLGTDNFTLTDNHQPARIAEAWPAPELPLHLAVVLLASQSKFGEEQQAAIDLAKQVLRPGDKAFVISSATSVFHGSPQSGGKLPSNSRIEWAQSADGFEKEVRALKKDEGLPDAFGYALNDESVGGGGRLALQRYSSGGVNVFDIIGQMWATDPRPARRVIVMFRDPIAHSPGLSGVYSKEVEAEHAYRIALAQQAHTPIFMIGVDEPQLAATSLTQVYNPIHAGEGADQRVYDEEMTKLKDRMLNAGRANAERMAEQTGGKMYFSKKKNYSDAVASIANVIHGQYVVTFVANAAPPTETAHPVTVDVNQKGAKVFAPRAYVLAPVASGASAGK